MSVIQTIQLCSRYIDTFGYPPKPNQLISFAKQNGVKVLYKNVKSAIQSIKITASTSVKINSHKSKQVTEPSNNHMSETDKTKQQTDTNKQPDNDAHSTDFPEPKSHNKSTVIIYEPHTEPEDSPITYQESENNTSVNYQIVVRRAHHLDIIINTYYNNYTFDAYTTYLCNNFNMIVTPTYLGDYNYNIMTNFSPICHRVITTLIPQKKTLKCKSIVDRIKYAAFGYIKNESCVYNLYVPDEIVFIAISYINNDDEKFSNPTFYEMQQRPTQIYKYGLFQKYQYQFYHVFSGTVKHAQVSAPMVINMESGYHSKSNYNSDIDYKVVCNVYILPLRIGSIAGVAVCDKVNDDIIDETIKYFRANIFKKTFKSNGNADLILIYLTAFISYCLRKWKDIKSKTEAMDSVFYKSELNEKKKYLIKCPGDKGFPFNDKFYRFYKPKTLKEKDIFMSYFKQLRGETLKRLMDKCYGLNGLQNKHWFQFSKRKFLNVDNL